MTQPPLVSVVMPAYNARRYVGEAVRSILSQTFGDFEFIIIDDGSTDGTREVLEQFAAGDARVRLVCGKNKGCTAVLNDGIRMARGSLIARMDSDDVSLPQRLEKQVRFLEQNPDHVLVGCRCVLIDPDGLPICEKEDTDASHEQIDARLMRMGWPLVHPAVTIRADALAKVGGYAEAYRTNQDHDLFLKLAEVGKLANLQEILFYYRQHFGSVGYTKAELQTRTVFEVTRAAYERRGVAVPDDLRGKPPEVLRPIEHRRNWAWKALKAGNVSTARRHAFAVFRGAPLSIEAWRTVYCALRGH